MSDEIKTAVSDNPAAKNNEIVTDSKNQTGEASRQGQAVDETPQQKEGSEEKSPYDLEIEKLKKIIEQKGRALEAEKSRNKGLKEQASVESKPTVNEQEQVIYKDRAYHKTDLEFIKELAKESVTPELGARLDRLEQLLTQDKQNAVIERYSSDPKERELIKLHLANSIKPSGNLEDDVRRAKILANERIIFSEKTATEKREEILASFSASGASGISSKSEKAVNEEVAALLDAMGRPNAKQFIK